MTRAVYRSLLRLHPAFFRDRFAAEMLWIFDETISAEGAAALLLDGLLSLIRQGLIRRITWKLAAAILGGVLEVGIVLVLSRNIYFPRADGVPDPSVAANTGNSLYAGLISRVVDPQNSGAGPGPTLQAGARPAARTPAGAATVDEKPLGFLVLFAVVLVYAFQRHRFQFRSSAVRPRSKHDDDPSAGPTPSRTKGRPRFC